MGFKEKMMGNMMDKMSIEEKKSMMNEMMGQFMGSMSAEEKQELMQEMMPKMMQEMMGGNGGGMMNMMSMMMGRQQSEVNAESESGGWNPMDMCRNMMTSMNRTSEIALHSTPEIQTLFYEWLQQIEEECINHLKENPHADADSLADFFKLSKESMVYILAKLAQKGKITLHPGRL